MFVVMFIDIMHIIHDVYGYIGLGVFASYNSGAVKHSSEHSMQGLAALQALWLRVTAVV